jgi:soluble lytic murein transglycosylase-like protein
MFVAAWRYSTALSLILVAGVLAQPALAHGRGREVVRHHHYLHRAYAVSAHHFAHGRGRRHVAFLEAAAEPAGSVMATPSYDAPVRHGRRVAAASWQTSSWQTNSWQAAPQDYWEHGWRGHLRQQTNWQPATWQQRQSWRRPRVARRQEAVWFGGTASYAPTPTYSAYAPQSSWPASAGGFGGHSALSGMIAQAASSAGVPLSLAERVVRRESGGNPRAVHAGNYGLMQIRLGTARAMGYGGSASGLLDPSVNMTYAMRYLAGAYRAAAGNESRAVALYARGYHAVPARARTYTF